MGEDVKIERRKPSTAEVALKRLDDGLSLFVLFGTTIEWMLRQGSPIFLSAFLHTLQTQSLQETFTCLEEQLKILTPGDLLAISLVTSWAYRKIQEGGTMATLALGPQASLELHDEIYNQQDGCATLASQIIRPISWMGLFTGLFAMEQILIRTNHAEIAYTSLLLLAVFLLGYESFKIAHTRKR